MALVCNGQSGDAYSADAAILDEPARESDSLDTLLRIAGQHRAQCEWAASPAGVHEHPRPAAHQLAEVHLKWADGPRAGDSFAVLRHLDYDVWDAWQPWDAEQQAATEPASVRLTRKDVNYETALMAVFRAMGDKMPEEFTLVYL